MSSHYSYINPESVFAQTALEMVASHGPQDASSDDMMCDRCQQPLPCPPVRNAILVLEGAGLAVHPAGSAEARRAAAESALGHAMPPSGGPPSGGPPSGGPPSGGPPSSSSPLTAPADLLGPPAGLTGVDLAGVDLPGADVEKAAQAPEEAPAEVS
jgi:hypothetical protein